LKGSGGGIFTLFARGEGRRRKPNTLPAARAGIMLV
jgi:hypothetical protein